MNSLERTLKFIENEKVDKIPFHPIIMRWAAKYAKIKYRDFCTNYMSKCDAMIKCADDFKIDWVTVMSDAYAEASAFGLKLDYPEDDLPQERGRLINKPESDIDKLTLPNIPESSRMTNRIKEVEEFSKRVGGKYFILGWVEGPMAEYADLRGLGEACMDLFDCPDKLEIAFDIILENAINFVTLQVNAGANCIGIGDAACSQIGPELYKQFIFKREKILVEHIHSLGALAKLHICGNTSSIIADMIKTGADIIDIDHLVPTLKEFTTQLAPKQVFSGKSDPVGTLENGNSKEIVSDVINNLQDASGRCIISAGCEITPDTTSKNLETLGSCTKCLENF